MRAFYLGLIVMGCLAFGFVAGQIVGIKRDNIPQILKEDMLLKQLRENKPLPKTALATMIVKFNNEPLTVQFIQAINKDELAQDPIAQSEAINRAKSILDKLGITENMIPLFLRGDGSFSNMVVYLPKN